MRRSRTLINVLWTAARLLLSLVVAASLAALLMTATVLVAGMGAPRVVVTPDVEGMKLEKARQVIADAGLSLKVTGYVYSNRVEEGSIVRTRPYPGKRVKTGRTVEALVSRGPREIAVPVLIGLKRDDAEQRIKAAHLRVGTVSWRSSRARVGRVIEQNPRPGKVVARDQAVDIIISGGPRFGTWQDPAGQVYLFRRIRVTVPEPEPVQRVHITTTYRGQTTTIYDRIHQPGDEVVVDMYGRPGTRVRVFIRDRLVFEKRL